MRKAWWLAALLALGCDDGGGDEGAGGAGGAPGDDAKQTGAPDLAGKADGALAPAMKGPLAPGTLDVAIEGRPAEFRVSTWGGTRLRIEATSPDDSVDPFVSVHGPLPGDADAVVAYNDDANPETFDSALEVTVDVYGAVRIVVSTYGLTYQDQPTTGQVRLTVTCLEGCSLPMIPLDQMLVELRQDVGDAAFADLVSTGIATLFGELDSAAAVDQQVRAALEGAAGPFPVLPLSVAGTAQPLLERPDHEAPAPQPVTFQLDELLTRGCTPARAALKPVHPSLPQLETGSRSDYTRSDCGLKRAQDFADVLNNLALDNGSEVVGPDGTRYQSVEDVFVALIDAGHHVRVENSRYYADFLGLYYKGMAVAAPVWLDTGIPLPGGDTFKLPAPHTHHTIYVDGPLVNATLMYYMGVSGGVSFRAVDAHRAPWTGERVYYTYDSAEDADAVVQLMVAAARLRRVWTERGQGLPALGYGALGVCNDSTAVLEQIAEGTVTIFPLANPANPEPTGDLIDRTLAALPSDLAGFDPADAARRIRATLPHTDLPGLQAAVDALP